MTRIDRTRTGRAFTMLEVMIVVSIMGVIMGFTVIALNSASTETAINTTEGAIQNTTNQFVTRLATEMRNASRSAGGGVRINATGSEIRFRVPVDVNQDGVADLDAGGNAVFGGTLGRNHVAGVDIVYSFRPNQVGGADETMSEGALGFDISGDNATIGTFKRGFLTRQMEDGVELPRKESDLWLLFGDEDGDGVEEPLFVQEADGSITIRLWAADILERQQTSVRAFVQTRVWPFNP